MQSVGLPEDNVPLFATASDLLVFFGVDEAVNPLLMQVKRSLLPVVEILELVHVNETIKRAR